MSLRKTLALAALFCTLVAAPAAFATDGVVLINQATATAGLPGCGSAGFPIVICQPGSYRLSGNLTVAATGINAISINAGHVTLDLNGFTIAGPGSDPTGVGVFSSQSWTAVENGQVTGFAYGLYLASNANVVRAVATDSNDIGIAMFSGLVTDSSADGNQSIGITTTLNYGDLAVVNSRAVSSSIGIELGGGEVVNSEVHNNRTGILVLAGHVSVRNNAIIDNSMSGMEVATGFGGTAGYGGNVFQNDAVFVLGTNAVSMSNNVCGLASC